MCDVCDKEESIGVVASSLGPISVSICQKCLEKPAEPSFCFEFIYEDCGEDCVASWVKELYTYYDNQYLTWDQFCEVKKGH